MKRLNKIISAVEAFNFLNTGFVLHSGDFVAPFSVREINKLNCRWRGVFGNNDGERAGLLKASRGRIADAPLRISLGKRKITVVHDLSALAGKFSGSDVVIYGHSHKPEIKEQGGILFINPGECGGWLSGKATIALLDTSALKVKIIAI